MLLEDAASRSDRLHVRPGLGTMQRAEKMAAVKASAGQQAGGSIEDCRLHDFRFKKFGTDTAIRFTSAIVIHVICNRKSSGSWSEMKKAVWLGAVLGCVITWASVAAQGESDVFESPAPPTPAGRLDQLIFARLSSLNIRPVLCSDAVFVRRAYLDVMGTLPTADEARAFIDDPDAEHKRIALIDRLLERPERVDYWAMKWGDVLRIKAEFPVNLWPNAAQAYHRYVRASLAENKPYDVFAREMLTASGSNFRVGQVNFYRAVQNKTPEGLAAAVALTFMGTRAELWPEDRLAGMTVFFSQIGYKPTSEWKEENVFWDPLHVSTLAGNTAPGRDRITTAASAGGQLAESERPPPGGPLRAVFPDGTAVQLPPDRDPRDVFADWLIRADNPWFARSISNRMWAWFMGRGIIHEPDDMREDNPPSNPALLAYLEHELVANHYDLKHLARLILTSTAYQFSSVPHSNSPEAEANFAVYPLRRLEAEVLIDAINQVTGASDLYTSPIPEPFTYIPKDLRAIAMADGSITSPFLTLFGRSARATGMESERTNKTSPAQWLHMLNSAHIREKLERGPKLRAILAAGGRPKDVAEELYMTLLSRRPTRDELQTVAEYVRANRPRSEAVLDVTWAVLNSTEFLYRH
jgi:hypothetical protein